MTILDAIRKPESKIKFIDITPEFLLELLRVGPEGTFIDDYHIVFTKDVIPKTANPLRCGITQNGDIRLLIEDESFDPVYEGNPCPQLCFQYLITSILKDKQIYAHSKHDQVNIKTRL